MCYGIICFRKISTYYCTAYSTMKPIGVARIPIVCPSVLILRFDVDPATARIPIVCPSVLILRFDVDSDTTRMNPSGPIQL
jgi:hypothetical protein